MNRRIGVLSISSKNVAQGLSFCQYNVYAESQLVKWKGPSNISGVPKNDNFLFGTIRGKDNRQDRTMPL